MFTTPLKLFASNSVCLLSSTKCPDRTPVWNLHSSSTVIYLFVSNAQSSCCLNTSVTWKAVIDSCSSNTWEIICLFGLPCRIKYDPTLLFGMVATFFQIPTSGPLHRSYRSSPLCAECTSESRWEVDEKNTHCQLVVRWDGRENILVDNWARLGVKRMGCNLFKSCHQLSWSFNSIGFIGNNIQHYAKFRAKQKVARMGLARPCWKSCFLWTWGEA